jgi:peptide/nickel transport system permease protein
MKMERYRPLFSRLRRSPLTLVGIGIIFCLLVAALLAPWIAPYDPYEIDPPNRLKSPSAIHWFGTDTAGRDILSRIVFGTRVSIRIGATVVCLAVISGSLLGLFSGYLGGGFDDVMMRITDVFFSVPYLILAMAITAALGPGLLNAMLSLSLVWWPIYARLIRGQVIQLREAPYVEAARASGATPRRIIFRHILPNALTPIIVQASLDFGNAIMYAAALSFIGLGAQPPTPEWGAMISLARDYLQNNWWFATFPGLAILVTVIGFNLLGDGIRDLSDPRLRET